MRLLSVLLGHQQNVRFQNVRFQNVWFQNVQFLNLIYLLIILGIAKFAFLFKVKSVSFLLITSNYGDIWKKNL